jgi:hypothetical protein
VRFQTLLALNAAGAVVDAFDIYDGKHRGRSTPRLIKKQFKARPDVVRVARITTRTLNEAGNV